MGTVKFKKTYIKNKYTFQFLLHKIITIIESQKRGEEGV